MGFRELGAFITSMERSGAEVNELRVERMLKIAIPITCIVILLFGAPLGRALSEAAPRTASVSVWRRP